jgi:thymidine phosphorylase
VVSEVGSPAGYVAAVDAESLGWAASALGAGRAKKGDAIDPAVGIEFFPKIGDRLEEGAPMAVVHARDEEAAARAGDRVRAAVTVSDEPVQAPPLVFGWYASGGTGSNDGSNDQVAGGGAP